MSEVERVATWAGLLMGVAGVVLSCVTIWFATATDRRSREISDQPIRSLQKIEAAVDRTSSDTQGLIKVAWDRMVVRPDSRLLSDQDASTEAITSGLTAELKADIVEETAETAEKATGTDLEQQARRLDELEKRLGEVVPRIVEAVTRASADRGLRSQRVARLVDALAGLSPSALEFFRILADNRRHITRHEYLAIRASRLSRNLDELRRSNLLTPLTSTEGSVVYFMPPSIQDMAGPLSPFSTGRIGFCIRS
jgi:hypothetical protein